MSGNVQELRPGQPIPPDVTGYVEGMTDTAALGWVWQPSRSTRLPVELRLGEQVVSRAVANSLRDDLARSGIGDGAHAFTLLIPEEHRARASELRVVACLPDGRVVSLEAPPPVEAPSDGLARLQRGVDSLIGSHRLMHRNLQAALVQHGPTVANSLTEIAAAQSKLEESLATLERFVVRIEQAIHGGDTPAPTAARTGKIIWIALVLSGLALTGSTIALARILIG